MNTSFYIETTHSPEELQKALAHDGIHTTDFRRVTHNEDGFIFTDLRIQGTWEHGTGYSQCQEAHQELCPSDDGKHLPWKDLAAQQQRSFARSLSAFIDASTVHFEPALAVYHREFTDVALQPH